MKANYSWLDDLNWIFYFYDKLWQNVLFTCFPGLKQKKNNILSSKDIRYSYPKNSGLWIFTSNKKTKKF